MQFDKIVNYLSIEGEGMLTWLVGLLVAFFVLFIFALIWKRVVAGKVRRTERVSGIQFGDLEKMRKEGLISEAEYRRLRQKVAHQELEASRESSRLEQDRVLMAQVEFDPDIARELLPEELKGTPKREVGGPPAAEPETVRARVASSKSGPDVEPAAGDPIPPDFKPGSSMNMPRVVKARNEAAAAAPEGAAEPRELDLLLEKGAITKEEYERLKSFFEK